MNTLEKALAGGIKRETLAVALWRRSAEAYLAAGELEKAAESRLQAGDKERAAELFFKSGNDLTAAELFFDCDGFEKALTCARRCRESFCDGDLHILISARLVEAAACSKTGDKNNALDLLRAARADLVKLEPDTSPFQRAQAWESLARCGYRIERPDLVRLGYEKALLIYGPKFNLQRLRCAHDYLEKAAGDHILAAEIKERIAGFRQEFATHE